MAALGTLLLGLVVSTCGPAPRSPPVPDDPAALELIERSIRYHGMERFDTLRARFTFRDRTYTIDTHDGAYTYTRSFRDTTGEDVVDQLTNDGLQRTRNGTVEVLSDEAATAYSGSVNSVRYFFMLPYALRDPAVNARLLDPVRIDGTDYGRVEVTFDRTGGGVDHDDVYHYFFAEATGSMDYLAYTFSVEDGGLRFRRAINQRRVGGVLVQDYINYGVDGEDRAIEQVVERYEAGELPELSRIENTEVEVVVGGQ